MVSGLERTITIIASVLSLIGFLLAANGQTGGALSDSIDLRGLSQELAHWPMRFVITILFDMAFALCFATLICWAINNTILPAPCSVGFILAFEILNAWQSVYLVKSFLFRDHIDTLPMLGLFILACTASLIFFLSMIEDRAKLLRQPLAFHWTRAQWTVRIFWVSLVCYAVFVILEGQIVPETAIYPGTDQQ